jgi:hypothetical protein
MLRYVAECTVLCVGDIFRFSPVLRNTIIDALNSFRPILGLPFFPQQHEYSYVYLQWVYEDRVLSDRA